MKAQTMATNNTKAKSLNFSVPSLLLGGGEVVDPEVARRHPDTQARLEAYEEKVIELARQYDIDTVLMACEHRGVEIVSVTSDGGRAHMAEFVSGVCDFLKTHLLQDDEDVGHD